MTGFNATFIADRLAMRQLTRPRAAADRLDDPIAAKRGCARMSQDQPAEDRQESAARARPSCSAPLS
jgi:hypothetical protein